MSRKTLFTIIIGSVVAIAIVRCGDAPAAQNPVETKDSARAGKLNLVERGKYLVTTLGCNDCHSTKKLGPQGPVIDSANLLAGCLESNPLPTFETDAVKKGLVVMLPTMTAFMGPWGTTFAANLTPDSTGIGSWSLDQFKKALREGKYKGLEGSRPLLPPMPWQNYINMTDDDVEAVFTYLKSVKPVKNVVPGFRPMK
ncbi:diheme cytochrome c-553 [Niastella koreensis]|uniref:Cytochrome c domain-containing protein n=2 Tax=Niastella koreensis TaxID=354356 RepID=G8TPG0_NIAKG|nr:c-type cytochrome [Niastella koreensis]AEV97781.1 hypothetical protein Niako_1410 [Niastella koreensis GR20-10]OQP40407.1 diheme cytochrome c-553 [Niastella koreensis]